MITGKELYEAARPFLEKIGFEGTSWEECNFGQGTQAFYLEIAQRLNEQHFMPVHQRVNDLAQLLIETQAENRAQGKEITALKALAQDFQRHLALMPRVLAWSAAQANVASWLNYKEELDQRAQQLIGEEK